MPKTKKYTKIKGVYAVSENGSWNNAKFFISQLAAHREMQVLSKDHTHPIMTTVDMLDGEKFELWVVSKQKFKPYCQVKGCTKDTTFSANSCSDDCDSILCFKCHLRKRRCKFCAE